MVEVLTIHPFYGADHIVDINEMVSTKHVRRCTYVYLRRHRFDSGRVHWFIDIENVTPGVSTLGHFLQPKISHLT